MKNASAARNLGTISGRKVSIQPSFRNSTYCGISVTWYGSISVPSMIANQILRPRNSSRANANAVIEHAIVLAMTTSTATNIELRK